MGNIFVPNQQNINKNQRVSIPQFLFENYDKEFDFQTLLPQLSEFLWIKKKLGLGVGPMSGISICDHWDCRLWILDSSNVLKWSWNLKNMC